MFGLAFCYWNSFWRNQTYRIQFWIDAMKTSREFLTTISWLLSSLIYLRPSLLEWISCNCMRGKFWYSFWKNSVNFAVILTAHSTLKAWWHCLKCRYRFIRVVNLVSNGARMVTVPTWVEASWAVNIYRYWRAMCACSHLTITAQL